MTSRLASLALAALLTASPAAAQSLDEILDRHFQALGGRDKLAAVQSARITGRQQFGPQEAPFTLYWKRPDKVRFEVVLQGMTGVQAYDGAEAWMVMPFLGKNDPEAMTGDDLEQIRQQADMIEGPLFNWKEKGHQVELVGKEPLEGTDAWKLKLTRKGGEVSWIWLDAEAMLEIKTETRRKRGDKEFDIESSLGDYKEVGGIVFVHSIEQRQKGTEQGATITIDAIELGVEIDDSQFKMPAVEKPAPAPPPAGGR